MARGGTVVFNDDAFRQMGKSSEARRMVTAEAQAVAALARSIAPVDTGDYRDGISVGELREGKRRVVSRVEFTDWKSVLIEGTHAVADKALKLQRKGSK